MILCAGSKFPGGAPQAHLRTPCIQELPADLHSTRRHLADLSHQFLCAGRRGYLYRDVCSFRVRLPGWVSRIRQTEADIVFRMLLAQYVLSKYILYTPWCLAGWVIFNPAFGLFPPLPASLSGMKTARWEVASPC